MSYGKLMEKWPRINVSISALGFHNSNYALSGLTRHCCTLILSCSAQCRGIFALAPECRGTVPKATMMVHINNARNDVW